MLLCVENSVFPIQGCNWIKLASDTNLFIARSLGIDTSVQSWFMRWFFVYAIHALLSNNREVITFGSMSALCVPHVCSWSYVVVRG